MSLLDALTKNPPKTGRKIDRIFESVDADERKALEEALRSPEWPSAGLARVLSANVLSISESSVRRYRKDVLGIDA